MKKTFALLLAAGALLSACSNKGGAEVKLDSTTDTVAYIIGMNIGSNLLRMDSTINVAAVCKGIYESTSQRAMFSEEEARTLFLKYVNVTKPEQMKAYENQFLEDIVKSNRSYARTTTGVTYTVDHVGDQNAIPHMDRDTVSVRYLIRTVDGKEVFSSYEKGDTLRCAFSELNKGMKEALRLIGTGGKINAWLPAETAYGAQGDAALGIAPNSTLYYEIELVDMKSGFASTRRKISY